jgi:Tol biopolymer transport system component
LQKADLRKAWITTFLAAAGLASIYVAEAQQPPGQNKAPAAKGGVQGRLTWFDRQGKVVGTAGEPGLYRTLSISRDGKSVAFERTDPQTQNRDLWRIDFAGGAAARLTSDPAWEAFPTWSPDDSRIIFTSNRAGQFDLYQKASNGTGEEELIYKSEGGKGPTSWSPDGRFLIYYTLGAPTHVTLLPLSPADRKPVPIVDPQFSSITARFSPDGRWIVYTSNESGRNEIEIRPFDAGTAGKPVAITNGGGRTPLWRADGREIYYIGPDGNVMAIELDAKTKAPAGTPKPLFKVPDGVLFWDVSPDGTRFLMPVP